jgi:hypothetical protein
MTPGRGYPTTAGGHEAATTDVVFDQLAGALRADNARRNDSDAADSSEKVLRHRLGQGPPSSQ